MAEGDAGEAEDVVLDEKRDAGGDPDQPAQADVIGGGELLPGPGALAEQAGDDLFPRSGREAVGGDDVEQDGREGDGATGGITAPDDAGQQQQGAGREAKGGQDRDAGEEQGRVGDAVFRDLLLQELELGNQKRREIGRLGDWEIGRLGDWEIRRSVDRWIGGSVKR